MKKEEGKKEPELKDVQRRTFLKYLLMALGGFLVGKLIGSVPGLFRSRESGLEGFDIADAPGDNTYLFKNFVVKERGEELSFFDKEGHEIFVVEK